MRGHYRRLPELFTRGTVVEVGDGHVMYLQALNPFEYDEARLDAQAAKARLVMALHEHGHSERAVMEAEFAQAGRRAVIRSLVNVGESQRLFEVMESIKNDPDWTERLEITERSDELVARPVSDPERQLLDEVNRDYLDEIQNRLEGKQALARERLEAMDDETLRTEFFNAYVEKRGSELAQAEFVVTELWYAARVCVAVMDDDNQWQHGDGCQHELQVFESKREVKDLPDDLTDVLLAAMTELNMSVREAKSSGRGESSSGSSPLPSEEAASTPSGPTATLATVPGT